MLDALNTFLLSITNPVLDWMLYLHPDLVLLIVAVGTGVILTVVRPFTTNQEYLNRCKEDRNRLKELIREAKRAKDKDALTRHRTTAGQIGLKTMKAEGKPLLVAIVPIALLATWAFGNIAFIPPSGDDPVVVKAYFTVPKIGKLVHMVPQDGIEAASGWVRPIEPDVDAKGVTTTGVAQWTLRCRKRAEPYTLRIRAMGGIYEKELLVDGRRYAPPIRTYEDGQIEVSEVVMREYRLLGFVPGIPWIGLQPWIVGYLVIVLPLSFILKPALRIN